MTWPFSRAVAGAPPCDGCGRMLRSLRCLRPDNESKFRSGAEQLSAGENMSEQEILANQKTILGHQASILENQKTILDNQKTIEKNQEALDEILQNQKEILAALKK
jgi:hypothetical protein